MQLVGQDRVAPASDAGADQKALSELSAGCAEGASIPKPAESLRASTASSSKERARALLSAQINAVHRGDVDWITRSTEFLERTAREVRAIRVGPSVVAAAVGLSALVAGAVGALYQKESAQDEHARHQLVQAEASINFTVSRELIAMHNEVTVWADPKPAKPVVFDANLLRDYDGGYSVEITSTSEGRTTGQSCRYSLHPNPSPATKKLVEDFLIKNADSPFAMASTDLGSAALARSTEATLMGIQCLWATDPTLQAITEEEMASAREDALLFVVDLVESSKEEDFWVKKRAPLSDLAAQVAPVTERARAMEGMRSAGF